MTLREATNSLYNKLTSNGRNYPRWLQSIGEAEGSKHGGDDKIVVYLVREPYAFEHKFQPFWPDQETGYPVEVHVIGQVTIGPP